MIHRQIRRHDQLTHYRTDMLILIALAKGPLQFAEVAKTISADIREHHGNGPLSRCLTRLVERGRVTKSGTPAHPVYELTNRGERDAQAIFKLLATLDDDLDG